MEDMYLLHLRLSDYVSLIRVDNALDSVHDSNHAVRMYPRDT